MAVDDKPRALTILDLLEMKQRGQKITCLTAYDASFGRLLDQAGIDAVLVGDSLGMVVKGEESTLSVSMDEMVYHTRCVAKATQRAWLIADLPFLSYSSSDQAALNAGRLMREGNSRMVKLEGGRRCAGIVKHLTEQGIPVCAHLGLTPQSIHQLGGFRVQGKDRDSADRMLEDARILEAAGAGLLVLECIPRELASEISRNLKIPTIGIGAGNSCDGQVLVLQDLLGIGLHPTPKFAKNFLCGESGIDAAVKSYIKAVQAGEFPGLEHGFE
ncbi:MAG: 3-methyl-2-oxobutanoate hydroxymethyltransferase [Methylococcaceae bacterium]|nr:3-methyl-2-oxobutanoate hydroxymethyltransferase [Methylococcaceae bacterium]